MRHASLVLLPVLLAFTAAAQDTFRAYPNSVEMVEGGRINTMVVVTDRERLTVRVPNGYGTRINAPKKSLVFTDKAGATAITMLVTTNSPGVMPDDDTLRAKAMAANPGGTFLQLASCATGYQVAHFVDAVRPLGENLTIKTRDVFIACPDGLVEFMFTTKSDEFEKNRFVLNLVLGSFRMDRIKKPE